MQHVEQMRAQHLDLQRRKETFDRRFEGAGDDVERFMKEHRVAFSKSHQQTVFRGLDLEAALRKSKVADRQANRFNSMLHECYGGRHAIRTYLRTGALVDIRVPPLRRLDARAGERRQEPKPGPNSNAARRRAKYYDALVVDMQTSDQQPESRTTKLWAPFAERASASQEVADRHFAYAADGVNAALARQRAREHGVSARSRSKSGERGWWYLRGSRGGRRGGGGVGSNSGAGGWRSGGGEWSNSGAWHWGSQAFRRAPDLRRELNCKSC